MPSNSRDRLQRPFLNGLNCLPLGGMLHLYLAYYLRLSPSSEGGIDEYLEGKMRVDLHTKTRPLGTFELSMVNQQYKEGRCCGSVLLSIQSGSHPYKISSMTFDM